MKSAASAVFNRNACKKLEFFKEKRASLTLGKQIVVPLLFRFVLTSRIALFSPLCVLRTEM